MLCIQRIQFNEFFAVGWVGKQIKTNICKMRKLGPVTKVHTMIRLRRTISNKYRTVHCGENWRYRTCVPSTDVLDLYV